MEVQPLQFFGVMTLNKITWIQPYYDLILNEIPVESKTILDVGAGYGINGFIMKKSRDAQVEAIEPFPYNLKHYDQVFESSWEKYHSKIPSDNYDVLVSTEMIEHMSKEDARDFLRDSKKHAKKVIVATPFQWEQQEPYDNNPHQVHKCLMTLDDFIHEDYKVRILGTITKKGMTSRIYCHPKWMLLLKPLGFKPTNIIGVWG